MELREWETAKEPEPPRSEAVLRSRMHLKEMGIPYLEFYKVIEFDAGLSAEKCNYLEEALLDMGILDALVIDEEYREKVMTADQECLIGICLYKSSGLQKVYWIYLM